MVEETPWGIDPTMFYSATLLAYVALAMFLYQRRDTVSKRRLRAGVGVGLTWSVWALLNLNHELLTTAVLTRWKRCYAMRA